LLFGSARIAAFGGMFWHAGPTLTAWPALRRAVFPALAGRGASDRVALTFDDGPDASSTPRIVAELDRLGMPATFFVLGSMVRRDPGLVRLLVDAGHEVALHGDRHRMHPVRTPRDVRDDLRRAFDTVVGAGAIPQWFRPPHGYLTSASVRAARDLGLRTVLWSAWGRDWTAHATPRSVADHVLADLRPGGTILLHDADCTTAPGAWRSALGALPILHDALSANGLRVVALRDHRVR
jgi:peptidoglycan/xylan/chitin deacetylase (PgdA/CDA1 family)